MKSRTSKSRLVRNDSSGRPIQSLTCNLLPKTVRHDTMEGRDFIVVPMVILTEGVHNGSDGPLLYPKDELSKTPAAWNHKPIVVYHPELNGVGISACDPDVITNRKVGLMMNTKFEKGRLRSEAWIEKDRADKIDPRIMAAVEANTMMELSTGMFVDCEKNSGEWNGEEYTGIARNYRPDHLAILPDKIGACSIKDGAGFLRNQEGGKSIPVLVALHRFLQREGVIDNEMSHSNIRNSLLAELNKKLGGGKPEGPWVFIEDVYSDFAVYEWKQKLYRIGYTAMDTGVTLSDEAPVPVVRVTEYRTVEGAFVGNTQDPNKKGQTTMEKKKMVDALIANSGGCLTEADRERLMGFSEDQLKKISCKEEAAAPKTEPKVEPTTNASTAQASAPAQKVEPAPAPAPVTMQGYVSAAPPEIREVLMNSLSLMNEEKTKLIEAITANKNNTFKAEDLQTRPLGELRAIARLAGAIQSAAAPSRQADYSGQGAVPTENQSGVEEPLEVPVINFEKKKAAA